MKLPLFLKQEKNSQNRIPIILQARIGSTRYPKKVLEIIEGKTLLEHIFERLSLIEDKFFTVLAIPETEENRVLDEIAKKHSIPTVSGPEEDVLRRYIFAVEKFNSPLYIRATADNPLVSWDTAYRIYDHIISKECDYVIEKGLPYGGALEIFTRDSIILADKIAYSKEDREHVTLFIKKEKKLFKTCDIKAPPHEYAPELRITVDTPEDMKRIKNIYKNLYNGTPIPLKDVINYLRRIKNEKV